jgi:hypothetical protein
MAEVAGTTVMYWVSRPGTVSPLDGASVTSCVLVLPFCLVSTGRGVHGESALA